MLLALGDITFDNLAHGLIRVSKLEPPEAVRRLRSALSAGELVGLFDFGPVPDERVEKTFGELMSAFRDVHGLVVPPGAFFCGSGTDDDPTFPIPANVVPVAPGRPIILVKYYLEMEARETRSGNAETDSDVASILGDVFKVSKDSFEFHLIDVVEQDT